jgi:hypothetical protein
MRQSSRIITVEKKSCIPCHKKRKTAAMESAIYQEMHTDKDGNPRRLPRTLTEEERAARRRTREARKLAAEAEIEHPTDDDDDDYGEGGGATTGLDSSSDSEVDARMDNEEVCALLCLIASKVLTLDRSLTPSQRSWTSTKARGRLVWEKMFRERKPPGNVPVILPLHLQGQQRFVILGFSLRSLH